ncbi:MAG: hypothetical protein C0506_05465 [Anaerolinea sp.]|nr:hypothetical protein [Anaerolinea sp.]
MTVQQHSDEITVRERDVLLLAQQGRSNREIAIALGITENTVRFHLKELHSKLGTLGDREQLRTYRWFGGAFLLGLKLRAATFATVATIGLASAGGFIAVRAAYDAKAGAEEARKSGAGCVVALAITPAAGTTVDAGTPPTPRCFASEEEKQAYYDSLP